MSPEGAGAGKKIQGARVGARAESRKPEAREKSYQLPTASDLKENRFSKNLSQYKSKVAVDKH